MDRSDSKMTGRLARVVLTAGVLCVTLGSQTSAEQLSKQQIFDALAGPPMKRNLSLLDHSAQSQQDQAFIEGLRHRSGRSLSSADRDHVAELVKERPNVDLEVNFDYNSARVTARAVSQLTELGMTLTEPKFKDAVMLVGGHTDAAGGDSYNQLLSERRAESVKRFLVEKFHIAAANLVTAGYGRQDLKNAANPFAPENRRVQIGNLSAPAQARR
jgi:outer membrane protein OmpA-like peptidoglycan-associated protein